LSSLKHFERDILFSRRSLYSIHLAVIIAAIFGVSKKKLAELITKLK
jgi:hypothetical protein